MAKRKQPRFTHVKCATPAGYRWLVGNARGATPVWEGEGIAKRAAGFLVTNEADWAQSLRVAEGKEI